LMSGTYNMTVTDANNRSNEIIVTIPETLNLELSADVLHTDCSTSTPGVITTNIVNGVAPLDYEWSNNGQSPNLNNLPAGNYALTVTDATGCIDSISVDVIAQGALLTSLITTPITCYDMNDGSLEVQTIGGFSDFNYLWEDRSTEVSRTELGEGDYEVITSDDFGCIDTVAISLSAPEPIAPVVAITNSFSAQTNDGSLNIIAISGGEPAYDITWNTGAMDWLIEDLSSGEYTLSITDALGCIEEFMYFVDFETGTNELTSESDLILFPNPFYRNEPIFIKDKGGVTQSIIGYQWYDIQGKKIDTGEKHALHAPSTSGLFILEAKIKGKKTAMFKVVVMD